MKLNPNPPSFQTREFVISTEGTYPQFVKFQAVQDRTGIVDGLKEGEKIKVYFDLRAGNGRANTLPTSMHGR